MLWVTDEAVAGTLADLQAEVKAGRIELASVPTLADYRLRMGIAPRARGARLAAQGCLECGQWVGHTQACRERYTDGVPDYDESVSAETENETETA